MEWIYWAFGSALFATATAILSKVGVKDVPSNLATAIRTCVILVLAWGIVLWRGEGEGLKTLPRTSLLFLVLSGLATGLSWLCYFRAVALGPIAKVSAIDKLSLPFTVICAALFLGENFGIKTLFGIVLIGGGTYLLIQK